MNHGRLSEVALSPLTPEQRQRLELLTAVRGLYPNVPHDERLELAEWLVTGTAVH